MVENRLLLHNTQIFRRHNEHAVIPTDHYRLLVDQVCGNDLIYRYMRQSIDSSVALNTSNILRPSFFLRSRSFLTYFNSIKSD